jgi:hypothetical protein
MSDTGHQVLSELQVGGSIAAILIAGLAHGSTHLS